MFSYTIDAKNCAPDSQRYYFVHLNRRETIDSIRNILNENVRKFGENSTVYSKTPKFRLILQMIQNFEFC